MKAKSSTPDDRVITVVGLAAAGSLLFWPWPWFSLVALFAVTLLASRVVKVTLKIGLRQPKDGIVSRAADSFVFGSGRPNDRFDDSHYLAAATLAGSILFLLSFFGLGIAFLIAGEDARWRSLWQQPLAAGICLWFWFMLDWFVLNTQVRRASRRPEGRGRK